MSENPIMLAHNVLDGASLSGNYVAGNELERMRDGNRHTWWEAPSTALQDVILRSKNLITNFGFEIDLDGWGDVATGGGAGTITRNTTAPINGDADLLVDATAANNGANLYIVFHFRPFFFRAGHTYRMMLMADTQEVAQKLFRFGFICEGLTEDPDCYDEQHAQVSATGHYVDVTPETDGWYHVYIRMLEIAATQFDDIVVNEVRDVDTLIVDVGHTLHLCTIAIDYRNTESAAWTVAKAGAAWNCVGPVYLTFTGRKALSWRIRFIATILYADVPVVKVPLLYLGKRWEIDRNRAKFYDPHEEARFDYSVIGDRGIQHRVHRYNQRRYRTILLPFSIEDYTEIEDFFIDTENGLKPFFFIPRPTTNISDILVMRMTKGRNAPYFAPNLQRQWDFDIEEVLGARMI